MAKLLETTGVSHHLLQLIDNANEKLILVSPYLKLNDRLKQSLEDKDRLKKDIRIVYGKNELHPAEKDWLASLTSIRISFLQNLHAKCYVNEHDAIVTSMNLYDFSQVNNYEIGIHINKNEDKELYTAVYDEVMKILRSSTGEKITAGKILQANGNEKDKIVRSSHSDTGFCIRCKAKITLNPLSPYCPECYGSWRKYKNVEYEEKYCHICSKPNKSSMIKPSCYDCYTLIKGKLEFSLV